MIAVLFLFQVLYIKLFHFEESSTLIQLSFIISPRCYCCPPENEVATIYADVKPKGPATTVPSKYLMLISSIKL